MLVPSIGPAYSFPGIWSAAEPFLQLSRHFQAVLIKNYQAVLRLPSGGSVGDVQLMFGVAAFPSLHVAFQTFTFLWMRRVWISGQVVFGIFALVILIGSVITGWHYLIDGIAGIVMAAFCYDVSVRMWDIRRWRRLRARQLLRRKLEAKS
jgi:membrane-associated phospholipid phosphatase